MPIVVRQSSHPVPEGKQSRRALSQTKSRRQWASVIICGRQQIQSLSADTEREGGRQDPEANGFSSAERGMAFQHHRNVAHLALCHARNLRKPGKQQRRLAAS